MVTRFNGNFVVSRNGLFAKKYFMEGCVILVDVRLIKDTYVYNEFDEVENTYWFDFKQKSSYITLIHFIMRLNLNRISRQILRI